VLTDATFRGITAPPIVMSDLLTSAEAERLKAGGNSFLFLSIYSTQTHTYF